MSRNSVITAIKRRLEAVQNTLTPDDETYFVIKDSFTPNVEDNTPQVFLIVSSDEITKQPIGDCPLKWMMRLNIYLVFNNVNEPGKFYDIMDLIDNTLYVDYSTEDIIETELNRWDVYISDETFRNANIASCVSASLTMMIRYVK